MSHNTATSSTPQPDQKLTTCLNCHTPMPSELRFCRNCGYRLGEGSAEYTETVRFSDGIAAGMRPTGPAQPLVTSYGLDNTPAAPGARKKCRKISGMTWMFLGLLVFFVMAAGFTAMIAPMRRAGIQIGRPPIPTMARSYVGVDAFDTAEGVEGVTFGNVEPPGSPADKAGLVGGDIITSFDGQIVKEDDEMTDLLTKTPVGKTVDVVYIRDGETKTTKLTTVSREEFRKLEEAFTNRPEGRGAFGYHDDRAETVPIPGTKMSGVLLKERSIDRNFPADMAGIKEGDIIFEFDGTPIRTPDELTYRIRRAIPYSTVTVTLMRGTEKMEIPVKMGKR
jgi:membrane-associated protease RseP (regulator of RpoE activity)